MFSRLSEGKEFIAAADWFLFSVWSQNIYLLSLSAQVHVPLVISVQEQGMRNVLFAYLRDYPPNFIWNNFLSAFIFLLNIIKVQYKQHTWKLQKS